MKFLVCTVLLIASSSATRDKRGIYGELDGLISPSLLSHSSLHHAPLSTHSLHHTPLYSSPLRSYGHSYSAPILHAEPLHSGLHSAHLLSSHNAFIPHATPLVSHATPLHVSPLHSTHLSPALPLSLSHSTPLIHSAPLSHGLSLPLDSYRYSHHSTPLHLGHSVLNSPLSLHSHSYPHTQSLHRPVVVKVIKAAPARYASGWW